VDRASRRPVLPLLLVPAAALLGGCAVIPRVVPLDADGMAHPAAIAGDTLRDQCARTGDRITGFPAALGRHVEGSWHDLMVRPR
jgi:hypothetical protein